MKKASENIFGLDTIASDTVSKDKAYIIDTSDTFIIDKKTVFTDNHTIGSGSTGITIDPSISGSSQPLGNGSITWPKTPIASNITIPQPTYTVLELPQNKIPEKIYVNGILMTCGLLGTDVDCAYAGKNKIIFAPDIFTDSFGFFVRSRIPKISVEYNNAIYHYVVDHVPVKGDNSTILDVRQVGMIKKGK